MCKEYKERNRKHNLLVLSATTYPMDLISHLPVFCEENGVSYIFVPSNERIKGYTCVLLTTAHPSKDMQNILDKAYVNKKQ